MKQGDVLNGYKIVSKPTNAGGGKCMWAFAARAGSDFFIKQFLDPKWPTDSAPGSPASKNKRRKDCQSFEQRHQHVMERLRSDRVGAGNIVIAEDFFRAGATYFKVTKRINDTNLKSLAKLAPAQKAVLIRTLLLSLQQLHDIDVVHGDLKPDNVLIQKRPDRDLYTAKLIDFDDSYIAGHPPARDTLAGDSLYFAPEWLRYIRDEDGTDGKRLTTAADMFGLGIMLHEYLTEKRPGFPAGFSSAGEAVAAGHRLTISPLLHPEMTRIVQSLTQEEPGSRPATEQVLEKLDDDAVLAGKVTDRRRFVMPPPAPRADHGPGPAPGSRPATGTRLKISPDLAGSSPGRSRTADAEPATAAPPRDEDPRKSRLRINLGPGRPDPPGTDKK